MKANHILASAPATLQQCQHTMNASLHFFLLRLCKIPSVRLLTASILLFLSLCNPLCSASDLPTLQTALPDVNVAQNTAIPAVDLTAHFSVPGITGQVVQFTTTGKGAFNVELNSTAAPNTVANFLTYVNANSYANSIIHRLDKSLGVIQGGGYLNNASLSTIAKNAPINLENGDTLPNARGTLAMARASAPNTATSEWFINTTDNSTILPPASSSGYAVFGRVTGTGMTVVDSIAALPVPSGILTVTNSSTTSNFVTVDGTTLPANFGPGWGLLGSTVQSVAGNFVTLAGNANQTITSPTTVGWSRLGSPFSQLPVLAALPADNSVFLSNLVTERSIKVVPIFPSTLSVNVTTSSTNSAVVGVLNPPAGFGAGSSFMGSKVTGISGNSVSLQSNADRTITSSTAVPASKAAEDSVVTFSVVNTNHSLVAASVSGSALNLALRKDRGGVATVTVNATDTNGNTAQSQFLLTVSGGIVVTDDSSLASLTVSAGTLTPAFDAVTMDYAVSVPNATASIMLTPTVAVSTATVKVYGVTVTSGSASGAITLNVGDTVIPVLVTAPNGTTTQTYTVTVTRLAPQYTVTPSAGANGSISPSTVQTVNSGGSAAFTATPDSGYAVDQWIVNGTGVQAGGAGYTASNVTANTTVQVTFTLTAIGAWRLTYFGTSGNTGNAADSADPDRDGSNNLFEYVAGLNPASALSRFDVNVQEVAGQPAQVAIVFGPVIAGRTYVVKSKSSLADPQWALLGNFSTSDNGAIRTVTDLAANTGLKLYIVEITLP